MYPSHAARPLPEARRNAEPLRRTWLLRPPELARLAAAYVSLTAVFVAVGLALTHPLRRSGLVRLDDRIERAFEGARTPAWNTASWWGSGLAETLTKIVVTAVVCVALVALLRRWYEALLVAVPLVLEAAVFLTVTLIVRRPRPEVVRLDGSPVASSFPSGHTAAAVCYAGIVVVVFLHTRRWWLRALSVALVAAVTVAVGLARMYRGMHHLTDVVAGALLGGASVWIGVAIVAAAARRAALRTSGSERGPLPGATDPAAPAR